MVLSLMIQIAVNYKTVAFDVPGTTKPPRMSPVGKLAFHSFGSELMIQKSGLWDTSSISEWVDHQW